MRDLCATHHEGGIEKSVQGVALPSLQRLQPVPESRDALTLSASAAAAKAALWLADFTQRRLEELRTEQVYLSLTGVSCGIRILNGAEPSTELSQAECRFAAEALQRFDGTEQGAFFSEDSLIEQMMSAAHLVSDDRSVARFREISVKRWLSVQGEPAAQGSPQRAALANCLALALGHQFSAAVTQVSGELSFQHLPNQYVADIDSIRGLITDLAILTRYGCCKAVLSDSCCDYFRDALPFWTFYYVKERDLDAVCPLLRGLKYMELDTLPEFDAGLRYVLSEVREDGRFGMLDMPAYLNALQLPGSIDLDRDLSLPVTTSSLLTLLHCLFPECTPLHNALRRGA